MKGLWLVLGALLLPGSIWAADVEGVAVPVRAEVGGETLMLNGAGVRGKFIFDIYVGALYLREKTTQGNAAITMDGPKRVSMHFLYDEVSGEKLAKGWSEGFERNQSGEAMQVLRPRLEQFNAMFSTVHEGDVIVLDYAPDEGTKVSIRGKEIGVVAGEDFNRALLGVWLGEKPADKRLKNAMLRAK